MTHPVDRSPAPLDERLRDDAALAEIELVSQLIIAASEADQPLSAEELDSLLGVAEPNDG